MVTFSEKNTIKNINELKKKAEITYFKMELEEKPKKDLLQKLCIEIAKHTPDAKKGKNEDVKNEKRLNPFVGALLLKEEEGRFEIYGASRSALHNGVHGECGLLLDILGDKIVDDCEMYVSLEPCTQESRHEWTEPCCEIIKNRRIKKVTIGMLDPNPDVAGHGISYLINSGVEVELFDPQYQKIVRQDNTDFSEQFESDGDPRLNRKIARILDNYISLQAIDYFMKEVHDELDIAYFKDRDADNKKSFFNIMIENRSIIDGKSNILPFDVINEFALFFFKKPYHKVDGATIRYIFDDDSGDDKHDYTDYSYDLPYIFAFETYDKAESFSSDDMGFIEVIGKRYCSQSNLKECHSGGEDFLKAKLGKEHGIEIAREAFLNAIMHRDYDNNHSFTKIVLKNDCIEIYNPIKINLAIDKEKLEELKNSFRNFEVQSNPTNPKLMRYYQLIDSCERNGSGMKSLKRSGLVSLELQDNYILKTIIRFN